MPHVHSSIRIRPPIFVSWELIEAPFLLCVWAFTFIRLYGGMSRKAKGSNPFLTKLLYCWERNILPYSMTRPLRIEYPGCLLSRNEQAIRGHAAFLTDNEYKGYLALLEDAWSRWDIIAFSYCLMETHYHLALQTPHGNLQRVMRHIDEVYTQRFNRAHKRDDPLFLGRSDLGQLFIPCLVFFWPIYFKSLLPNAWIDCA